MIIITSVRWPRNLQACTKSTIITSRHGHTFAYCLSCCYYDKTLITLQCKQSCQTTPTVIFAHIPPWCPTYQSPWLITFSLSLNPNLCWNVSFHVDENIANCFNVSPSLCLSSKPLLSLSSSFSLYVYTTLCALHKERYPIV